ncbi:MAG: hypothetical protein AWM53_01152 [Candidatus Dichloromethanomonas elyunquensis]|nr:MAG: hypothetical protein AWM53_01152 [Candidatus Dichloromethanomonas elyunquensis]
MIIFIYHGIGIMAFLEPEKILKGTVAKRPVSVMYRQHQVKHEAERGYTLRGLFSSFATAPIIIVTPFNYFFKLSKVSKSLLPVDRFSKVDEEIGDK